MKKCIECGALNQDSDAYCGVCGGSLAGPRTSFSHVPVTNRRMHTRGLIGLIVGLSLLVSGVLLLGTSAAPVGFFLLFFGVASVGAVIGIFKGLPYQPNTGWHSGGDPDLVATMTKGAKPANFHMLEVDREIESKKKDEERD